MRAAQERATWARLDLDLEPKKMAIITSLTFMNTTAPTKIAPATTTDQALLRRKIARAAMKIVPVDAITWLLASTMSATATESTYWKPDDFRERSLSRASSTQSCSYRSLLSNDEALEDDMTSFDSLLSRLLPDDSPLLPTRPLRHQRPGCKDCYFLQAHPLTKYEQYEHDMRQLNKLLNEREIEWSDFAHELTGSEHWEYGFNGWVSVQKLQHKMGCMFSATEFWELKELEQQKGDMGVEELAQWMEAGLLQFQDQMGDIERQMELEEMQAVTGGV
ncbi:MAG: hypothetical protein Q9176_005901 [Flavoplaca citrina]